MKVETITFDRVFDVARRQWKTGRWTEFGFVSGGRKVYGARVQGHPPLADGMTVIVVQSRAGQWSSLLGWKDLRTGELHVEDRGAGLGAIALIAVAYYALFAPLMLPSLLSGDGLDGMSRLAMASALSVPAVLLAMHVRWRLQHRAALRLLLGTP